MGAELSVTVQPRAPMALHRSRAAIQYLETLDYIPGAALRGAVAEIYLARNGEPDRTFEALFVSGQVHFGDLWPAVGEMPTYLVPITGMACKRYRLEGHPESFRDGLLDALVPEQSSIAVCPECGGPLDRVDGYLSDLANPTRIMPRKRFRVGTAMERTTGGVARGLLFSRQTLIAQQWRENKPPQDVLFRGSIRVADEALSQELYRSLAPGKTLFIGAGRTRGLGEVVVEQFGEAPPAIPLRERWERLNTLVRKLGPNVHRRYFSVTLLSHVALRDPLLRPVLGTITPEQLGLPAGVSDVEYLPGQPVRFVSTIVVSGWNAAIGLPKPDTVALARGAVFLFRCDATQEQAVLDRLEEMEAEGIGERRAEGFGRVAACYPVHYERWRNDE